MGSKEARLLREVYAAHQILMHLGFDAGDIHVVVGTAIGETVSGDVLQGELCLMVHLEAQGKRFVLLISTITDAQGKAFEAIWDAFARTGKRSTSVAELDRMLYGSECWRRRVQLLADLTAKGFEFRLLSAFQ